MANPGTRSRPIVAMGAVAASLVAASGCGPTSVYVPPGFTPQEAAWEGHHDAERRGDLEAAAAGYGALCEAEPGYTRACYDRVRVLFEMGRTEEARAGAAAFAIAHHGNALAPTMVKRLGASFADAGEAEAGVAALEGLAAKTRGTEIWDSVEFEIARLHRARRDGEGEARALAKVVALGRWGGQLWPDAIWRLIELASDRGDRAEEERLLEELIAAREDSRLIASYDTKFHGGAYLRLGKLLLERGALDRAYDTFMALAAWETSRQRDDGLYWAAVVRLRQGRAGDACALLRKVAKMDWSNSVDDAAGLAREAGCGGGAAGQ